MRHSKAPVPPGDGRRLRALDALRGVAAFSVVLFHLRAQGHSGALLAHLPNLLRWPFFHGNVGVQIFFVLSGFVIAMSMDGHVVDAKFIRRFALRRSLRLDPVYWGCLAFILVPPLGAHLLGVRSGPLSDVVSLRELLANLFYLPAITNTAFLHPGAWTLCFEVQFYLLYALLRSVARRFGTHQDAATIAMAAALCLLADVVPANRPYRGSILHVLILFLPGIAASRLHAVRGDAARSARQRTGFLFAALAASAWPLAVGMRDRSEVVASGVTGVVLVALILGGHLRVPFGRVLQYLGSRSYSLYLFHMVAIVGPTAWLVNRLDNGSIVGQLAATFAMLGVELLLAELAYRALERTSVRFAHRIGQTGPLWRPRLPPAPKAA